MPVSWTAQPKKKKLPEFYVKDRVEKYAQYFKGNKILPIPKLAEVVKPKTLSFIITDLRTSRLAGIKKDTFEESQPGISVDAALPSGISCFHQKN